MACPRGGPCPCTKSVPLRVRESGQLSRALRSGVGSPVGTLQKKEENEERKIRSFWLQDKTAHPCLHFGRQSPNMTYGFKQHAHFCQAPPPCDFCFLNISRAHCHPRLSFPNWQRE